MCGTKNKHMAAYFLAFRTCGRHCHRFVEFVAGAVVQLRMEIFVVALSFFTDSLAGATHTKNNRRGLDRGPPDLHRGIGGRRRAAGRKARRRASGGVVDHPDHHRGRGGGGCRRYCHRFDQQRARDLRGVDGALRPFGSCRKKPGDLRRAFLLVVLFFPPAIGFRQQRDQGQDQAHHTEG
jgi:hypothetical protein